MIEDIAATLSINPLDQQEVIDTLLAERSFANFVKQSWSQLEPTQEIVWGWHLDAICEHLEAVTRGEITRLIINIPPRHTKPVEENTLVLMGDGSRKRIKDVAIGDSVITHRGRSCKVLDNHFQGDLPVLKLTTHSGREVISAYDHPFLTPNGWVRADELQAGDVLGLVVPQVETCDFSRSVGLLDCIDVKDEEYRLIGYFIGDGCTTFTNDNSCHSNIVSFDDEETKDIIRCVKKLGFDYSFSKANGRINIKGGVRNWLKDPEIDLAGKGGWTKRVPEFIFKSSKRQIANFISSYFLCDGLITKRDSKRKDPYLNISSVSKGLLEDVQHLLLRFGIRARIRRRVTTDQSFKSGVVYYVLEISDQDNMAKFRSRISLLDNSPKQLKLNEWPIRRKQFDSVLLPDPVISIEKLDECMPCYCLTVDEDHSFTANDIAVHNSLCVSVMWPAWEWITNPGIKWLFSSYALDLSIRDSVKCRRLIQSEWYQRRWGDRFIITSDQNQKMRFENDKHGYRIASSVGGVGTGEGGDRIVCFPYDTYIATEEGPIKIGDIVENQLPVRVYSYNDRLQDVELSTIEVYEKNESKELYWIISDNGAELVCTYDHRIAIYKNKQIFYVEAKDIRIGDLCLAFNELGSLYFSKISLSGSVSTQDKYVYNMKIAGNRNYFATMHHRSGNFILVHNCDDPHNVKDVESDTVRNATLQWWDEVMSTRSNDPKRSARVIIMQRSHENDLTGHILAKEGVDYVHLCLPARYDPSNVRTRTPLDFQDPRTKPGEPLNPERFDEKSLARLELELGQYAAAGQLQQDPHPRGGGMFEIKNFILTDHIPEADIVNSVRYWDKAGSTEDTSKRTAGVLMHRMRDGSFIVADVVTGKWSSTDRERIIKQTAELDGKKVNIWIEQEPGSGGKESAEGTIRNLAGWSCYADRVTGSKEVRADQYAAQVGIKNVKLLNAKWTRDFIREHESFPVGKLCDQVDATAGAFNHLWKFKKAGTWGRRRER